MASSCTRGASDWILVKKKKKKKFLWKSCEVLEQTAQGSVIILGGVQEPWRCVTEEHG